MSRAGGHWFCIIDDMDAARANQVVRHTMRGASLRTWHCHNHLRGQGAAHAGFELTLIRAGYASYRCGAETFDARTGDVVLVPASIEHETTLHPGLHATVVELSHQALAEIDDIAPLCERIFERATVVDGSTLAPLLLEMEREAAQDCAGKDAVLGALQDALMVRMFRFAQGNAAHHGLDARIRAARDWIHSHVEADVTVEELASIAGMSRFHFSREFRRTLGCSPYNYVLRVRAEHAAKLLGNGASVTEAAFSSGFSDLGRFRSAFRKRYGALPSACQATGRSSC